MRYVTGLLATVGAIVVLVLHQPILAAAIALTAVVTLGMELRGLL